MYVDERKFETIFNDLEEGDKVIVRVSEINPKVIKVENWDPTENELCIAQSYNIQVDTKIEQKLIKESEKCNGTIYKKLKK